MNQPLEQIVQKIALHSRLRRTWPLKGGMSAAMTAMEIESREGQTRRLILRQPGPETLKQNPQAAEIEFTLLQRLHSLGLPVSTPCLLELPGEIVSAPCLVVEYIEGEPEFAPADLGDYLRQCAAHLARIHRVTHSPHDLSFLPEHSGACAESGPSHSTAGEKTFEEERIWQTLQSFLPLASRNLPTLLHGDFWPGNLLWQDHTLVAVIDWEDSCLGDPLADLAISRLDILCIFGIEALDVFTHHYLAQRPLDVAHLPYWDLCASRRLLRLSGSDFAAWAAFYPPAGRPDITEQSLKERLQFFIAQALAEAKT